MVNNTVKVGNYDGNGDCIRNAGDDANGDRIHNDFRNVDRGVRNLFAEMGTGVDSKETIERIHDAENESWTLAIPAGGVRNVSKYLAGGLEVWSGARKDCDHRHYQGQKRPIYCFSSESRLRSSVRYSQMN